jgi:hypothetical protein
LVEEVVVEAGAGVEDLDADQAAVFPVERDEPFGVGRGAGLGGGAARCERAERIWTRKEASMATKTTAQTARASHASSLPSVASQETCSALPSSRLATTYMPTGKTMLHRAGS